MSRTIDREMESPRAGIPVLDLSAFEGRQAEFACALGEAFGEYGFVGVINHGVDESVTREAEEQFRALFELPVQTLERYAQPGTGGARGYTGFGVEHARDRTAPDLKEFWQVGREIAPENNPLPDVLLPNLWPAEVNGFRSAALALYHQLDTLGRRLLSGIACHLGLAPDWFESKVDRGNSILRAIHYPPLNEPEPGAVRAASHEDINVITLLIGSREDGLEILSRGNEWVPVRTPPGTIVVNVGDMLSRLTNDRLRSTTHRVVNPEGAAAGRSRYSMPYFVHFNPDFEIRTLPGCVDPEHPDRYPEPITARDFLTRRLREIGLLDQGTG